MPISWNPTERVFRLDTPHTTYLMGLAFPEGLLGHIYYGPRVPDDNLRHLMGPEDPEAPSPNPRDMAGLRDGFPYEYPTYGGGDFRQACLKAAGPAGAGNCELYYESHTVTPGKPGLPGLPAAFGGPEDCETLEIVCREPVLDLRVRLLYTAFTHIDALCRSVRVENAGSEAVTLDTALSACLDLDGADYDVITLHGAWARERTVDRRPLCHGKQGAESTRGISSHQFTPGLILCEHNADYDRGLAYGMSFVYSGNFLAQAELAPCGTVRAVLGIHPEGFTWRLEPGASFQAPEVILACSEEGLGGMSRTFHDLLRQHLIRGQQKVRPSLVNSWESFYFNFDTDRLLELGREAARQGIELLVLDDGWFGKRNDDNSSLGDWQVNEAKLPGGLKRLGEELNQMGVKLGVWMEPEMISPDSDLYRAHPDYAMTIPGRPYTLSRNQLVLDLTRREVRECVYAQIRAVLESAPIAYVKWDMNRPLTDVYSPSLPPERQGEVAHRYMLGVYELQERLVTDFPELLLENCAGGGSRFDAGMLYYGPQIWTSDNAEAVDRLGIQEGAALLYPYSAMGAHVAACPSHTNGRVTPFRTRGRVSLPGCFGYELDLNKLTEEEKAMIPEQLAEYRQFGPVFHEGDAYRLASFRENGVFDAVMAVTKDRSLAVVDCVQVRNFPNVRPHRLTLRGLDPGALYRDRDTGVTRSGLGWMRAGLLLPRPRGDCLSTLIVLDKVEQ